MGASKLNCLQSLWPWHDRSSLIGLNQVIKCVFALIATSFAACTQTVKITHSDVIDTPKLAQDIFDTRVVVQAPEPNRKDRFKRGGFLAVGLHNRWDIDFATTTPPAVADALRASFADVNVVDRYERGCKGCGMIVRPSIKRFGFNKLTMQATIELDIDIYDAYDNHVTTFEQKGQSPVISLSRIGALTAGYFVPFSSTLLGKPVVSATVKSALDDAMSELTERFANESQVGGSLARVWRPKKEGYGTHEFAAEKVARKMGCDLSTDGIHLISEHYGQEVYDAYCYEPGRFKISCDLGRCHAEANPLRPIASQSEGSGTLN